MQIIYFAKGLMTLDKIKKLEIPQKPGCYKFLSRSKKIIYIGKAANLKNRILSYWQKSTSHSPAKYSMLKQVSQIDWLETDSEIEALLLEANLIKKHQPPYNIVLRDDKRYVYIKISTEEEWPRIFITRKLEKSGKYFGPFVSVEAVRQTLKSVRKIWPYRSCARLPKKICLYYRIGKCPGMCEGKVNKSEYKKIIKQITLFLEGKKMKISKEMEREIKKGEKKNQDVKFLKYRLINMQKVLEHANIISLIDKYATDVLELAKVLGLPRVPERIEGYDISNIFGRQAVGSMVVFSAGEPDKNEYRKFKIKIGQGKANDVGMLKEVLERRFNNDWPLPDFIVIDGGKAQLNVACRVLKGLKLDIPVLAISKGEGLRSAQALDKIFFPGEKRPLELPLASPALHIIKRVRDEAHRFAILYHRQLRKKSWHL
jgi:excinuclease ABC subunit C